MKRSQSLFLSERRFLVLGHLAGESAESASPGADHSVTIFFQNENRSFAGSRAWWPDQVADALAVARKSGKSSIWLTMTCFSLSPKEPWSCVRNRSRRVPEAGSITCLARICRSYAVLQCVPPANMSTIKAVVPTVERNGGVGPSDFLQAA
jgi:hypothetical protein